MLLVMGDFNAKVGSREPSAMSSAAHRLGSLPAGMLAANVAARQLPMPAGSTTTAADVAAYPPPAPTGSTSTETLTAQSLLLLGRHTASSSPHSCVHHWPQTSEPMAPPPTQAVINVQRPLSTTSAFASGHRCNKAGATRYSYSRAASRSTGHTRRGMASSLPVELFGFYAKYRVI